MKYLIIIFLFIALINSKSFGQGIDESRMQKDIEVSEAILNEIFNNSNEKYRYASAGNFNYFLTKNVKESTGVHVENYGVIFKVPQVTQKLGYIVIDGKRIIARRKSGNKTKAFNGVKVNGQKVKKYETDSLIFYYIDEKNEVTEANTITLEAWEKEVKNRDEQYLNDIKEKVEQFFTTYADLIGQLGPEDKIMLVSQPNRTKNSFPTIVNTNLFYNSFSEDGVEGINLTAEIKKSDLIEFKSGKISEEEFLNTITYSEGEEEENNNAIEYEVLTSVFKKLFESADFIYKGKTSKFDAPNVRYERLYNFGIIYEISTNTYRFSGNSPRKELVFMNGKMETIKADEKEEYLEEVKQKQEEFISQIKEYMVQYGRTLKSLKANEILMLDVVLNSNNMINSSRFWDKTDDTTKKIKLTISKADLDSYDKGTISFEDAVAKVKVKEY